MSTARRTEPLQAVVMPSGYVTDVIVCDAATAQMFEEWGVFTPSTMEDCTGLAVAMGWTFDGDRDPRFRPPWPGEGWTWDEDDDVWVAPPPDPEPEPPLEPEQPADPEPGEDPESTPDRG